MTDDDHDGACPHEPAAPPYAAWCRLCGAAMPPEPEPVRAQPAPPLADMLDRALGQSAWDRIGKAHGR